MFWLRSNLFVWIVMLVFAMACHTHETIVKTDYDQTRMNQIQADDPFISNLIAPYKDSLDKTMDQVLAYCRVDLKKEQPEGTLGNFVCDAMMNQFSKLHPDLCVVNYGGLRIPFLPSGPITKRKIFELAPFDNTMEMVYTQASTIQQLCDLIASKKGWPVAGVSFQIAGGKAINIMIKEQPMQNGKTYRLLTNDYVAKGGDNCDMLKNQPAENTGITFRDALITYLIAQQMSGKKIVSSLEGRIMNEAAKE